MRYFTFLSAVLALAPLAMAQTAVSHTQLSTPPTYLGTYSIAAQSFVTAPPPGIEEVVFDNTTGNGSFFAAGAGVVAFDWGTLAAGGKNDIVAVQIGYATTTLGTVDLSLSLCPGGVGSGDPGAPVLYDILGLPGSASGGAEGFIFDVTLPGAQNIPDGPLGWGYEFADAGSGPLTIGPPNEAGVVDAFDRYTSGYGAYVDTVFFGGNPFASFHMQLAGMEPECHMVIGGDMGLDTFQPHEWIFQTQVQDILASYPVLLDDIPEFTIPGIGANLVAGLEGGPWQVSNTTYPTWLDDDWTFTVQVLMHNPIVFPEQPEQWTHGLRVAIRPDGSVKTRPYGIGTGMQVWCETSLNGAGETVIRFPFSIPGMN